MEDKKISITAEDWNNLIPGKEVSIASQKVTVRPLGFRKLTETIRKIKSVMGELSKTGISAENYSKLENLMSITTIVLENIPEIISDSCNLDPRDIPNLPVQVAIKLIEAIIDVNIDSQKGLLKNCVALAEKTTTLVTEVSGT